MKKRIISGTIFLAIIMTIIFVNNPLVDTSIVFVISVLGIYEYNRAFKKAGYKPISWVGYIGCLSIFLMGGIVSDSEKILIIKIALPILLISIFTYIIIIKLRRTIIDVAITIFSLIYIPFMFSFIKLILLMENSRILIWYVFMGAFASDTSAYFIGKKYGKHKLCPEVSPNKTIEGSIAGIIGVIIAYIIITVISNTYFSSNINILYMIIAGIVAGIAGQFGDLSASAIKRNCKIKDFGDIIPGHGGILDRFDSLLFVAPVIYIFLKVYIII